MVHDIVSSMGACLRVLEAGTLRSRGGAAQVQHLKTLGCLVAGPRRFLKRLGVARYLVLLTKTCYTLIQFK